MEPLRFADGRHEIWRRERSVATLPINNPQRILQTLDSFLERQTRVVLFGRAALTLGFGDVGARFGKTQDVDAILPTVEMAKIESDTQFWTAIDLTNKKLSASGLYLSHLFTDRQVALTPDWLSKIVPVPSGGYKYLQLFRPSAHDLILTKMMRNDREDIEDISFLMEQEKVSPSLLDAAFKSVPQIEISEQQIIFEEMQPVVRKMALAYELAHLEKSRSKQSKIPLDPDWWAKLTNPTSMEKGIEKDREIEF